MEKKGTHMPGNNNTADRGSRFQPPSRKPRVWPIICLAVALVIAAAAVYIFVLRPDSGDSLIDSWHNEEYNQLLRFHEDETVVIRTGSGDYEATYLFDEDEDKGVITLNGAAISFTLAGDELTLLKDDVETVFTRGDMAITAEATEEVAEVAETVTETPEPTEEITETPEPTEEVTATPEPTAEPTETPEPTEAEPSPTSSGSGLPTVITVPGNVIGIVASETVVGTWYKESDPEYYGLVFYNDGTCDATFEGEVYVSGPYTFSKITGEGAVDFLGEEAPFTVDGDTLTFDSDETVYIRES